MKVWSAEELLPFIRSIRVPQAPLKSSIRIDRLYLKNGDGVWAIREDGLCLSKSGEWLYEPLPSSRSDEFINSTRFDSLDKAIQMAQQFMD